MTNLLLTILSFTNKLFNYEFQRWGMINDTLNIIINPILILIITIVLIWVFSKNIKKLIDRIKKMKIKGNVIELEKVIKPIIEESKKIEEADKEIEIDETNKENYKKYFHLYNALTHIIQVSNMLEMHEKINYFTISTYLLLAIEEYFEAKDISKCKYYFVLAPICQAIFKTLFSYFFLHSIGDK